MGNSMFRDLCIEEVYRRANDDGAPMVYQDVTNELRSLEHEHLAACADARQGRGSGDDVEAARRRLAKVLAYAKERAAAR